MRFGQQTDQRLQQILTPDQWQRSQQIRDEMRARRGRGGERRLEKGKGKKRQKEKEEGNGR
jgi:hypothetical protein